MAVPILPLAYTALRVGAVAATAYYVVKASSAKPKSAWREAALDEVEDGLEVTGDRSDAEANAHGAARFRRVIRLRHGPAVEVDFAALGRIRFRRVD